MKENILITTNLVVVAVGIYLLISLQKNTGVTDTTPTASHSYAMKQQFSTNSTSHLSLDQFEHLKVKLMQLKQEISQLKEYIQQSNYEISSTLITVQSQTQSLTTSSGQELPIENAMAYDEYHQTSKAMAQKLNIPEYQLKTLNEYEITFEKEQQALSEQLFIDEFDKDFESMKSNSEEMEKKYYEIEKEYRRNVEQLLGSEITRQYLKYRFFGVPGDA